MRSAVHDHRLCVIVYKTTHQLTNLKRIYLFQQDPANDKRKQRSKFSKNSFKCRRTGLTAIFTVCALQPQGPYTDKKTNFPHIQYKEIQSGAVAKSYMRKGFLIYEEMRKYFPLYE